jgi:hypothetical protein
MDKLHLHTAAAPTSSASKVAATPAQPPLASPVALACHWPPPQGLPTMPRHWSTQRQPHRPSKTRSTPPQLARSPKQPLALAQSPSASPAVRSAIGTHRGALRMPMCLVPPGHPFFPQSTRLYKGQCWPLVCPLAAVSHRRRSPVLTTAVRRGQHISLPSRSRGRSNCTVAPQGSSPTHQTHLRFTRASPH